MKLLDQYLIKKLLSTFFFVVLILMFIIIMIDFSEKNDDFVKKEVPTDLVINYYLTMTPFIASLLTPITVFIATVFVTAKLAARTEVIAILSSGVSFTRMMFPYLLFAIIIGVISFFLNSYALPYANKYRLGFEYAYLKKPFYFSEKNIHFKIASDAYLYMERYNNQNDVGYDVTLEKVEGTELIEKLHAKTIKWDTATSKWSLANWSHRVINQQKETMEFGPKMDTLINLSPTDFDRKDNLESTLTLNELNDYIRLQQSRNADDVDIYLIEKNIRFMQPFAVIVLTMIGVIVSARKSRGGVGFQIALGFLIAFLFVIFYYLSHALAESNQMNMVLAIWLPNITFSVVGIVLYFTIPR